MAAGRLAVLATRTFLLAALTGNVTSAQQPPASAPQPLPKRIALTDRSKMTHVDRRHDGAPGGIGHHYHTRVEEMFVIFDNEAEFTVDGRTARLAGPVGAPIRYDHSHALYNPTDRATQWMNMAVSAVKGVSEVTRNVGDPSDDRIGVTLDRQHASTGRQLRDVPSGNDPEHGLTRVPDWRLCSRLDGARHVERVAIVARHSGCDGPSARVSHVDDAS